MWQRAVWAGTLALCAAALTQPLGCGDDTCVDTATCEPASGGAGGAAGDATGGSTGGGGASTGGAGGTAGGGMGGTGGAGGVGGASGGGGNGGAGAFDVSCYAGSPCNPMVGIDCGPAGSSCDIGGSNLQCYTPGGTAMEGEACDDTTFCAHGTGCFRPNVNQPGECRFFCCASDICPNQQSCMQHPVVQGMFTANLCL